MNPAVLGPAQPFKFKGGFVIAVVEAERHTRVVRLDGLVDQAADGAAAPNTTAVAKARGKGKGKLDDALVALDVAATATARPSSLSTRPNIHLQVKLAGIGISVISATPQELLFVTLGDLDVFYSDSDAQTVLEATIVRSMFFGAGRTPCAGRSSAFSHQGQHQGPAAGPRAPMLRDADAVRTCCKSTTNSTGPCTRWCCTGSSRDRKPREIARARFQGYARQPWLPKAVRARPPRDVSDAPAGERLRRPNAPKGDATRRARRPGSDTLIAFKYLSVLVQEMAIEIDESLIVRLVRRLTESPGQTGSRALT